MLSTEAAGLAIKIARGLIKITRRIDVILAEKEAVQGPLAIPVAKVNLPPTQPRMRRALRKLLNDTEDKVPDPLGMDRNEIMDTVDNNPDKSVLFEFMQRYLPEQAIGRHLDLNSKFLNALQGTRPDLAMDPDLQVTAFYINSGTDSRNKDYSWRIALTVVDVLAEFGSENMALFTRNRELQSVAGAVLQRFANADIQETGATQALLRTVLSATLNGALDARSGFGTRSPWIDSVLDALLTSREALPAEQQDNFIAGLLQGTGYPLLVATVLDIGAGELDDAAAGSFKDVAADVLDEVVSIIRQKPGFEGFYNDQWGTILRAGLTSVQRHGPALLNSDSPLLNGILVAVVKDLSKRPANKQLAGDVVPGMVEAAVASIAMDPTLIDDAVDQPWLASFISSIATTLANKGLRDSFTRRGLEGMLKNTLATFSAHPELIIETPGLARDLTQGVLKSVGTSGGLAAEELASTAIEGALQIISSYPELINYKYPQFLATFAGQAATLVQTRQLTRLQANGILRLVGTALARNPALFLNTEKRLAGWVLDAVVEVADNEQGKLLVGTTLVGVVEQVLYAQAMSGNAALKNFPAASLASQLAEVLGAGLLRAESELGNRMSLPALPFILGQLVTAWNKGEVATVNPDNDNFRRLFSQLVDQVAA